MRIIAGELGGRRLAAPRGLGTRPTSDRVKEALFNILGRPASGDGERFRVLDLFAGSGALALEALSRGADEAVLVEHDADALLAAQANVDALGLRGRVRLLPSEAGEALRALAKGPPFDWIFLDPPYDKPGDGKPHDDPGRPPSKPGNGKAGRRPDDTAGDKPKGAAGYGSLDRALRLLANTPLVAGVVIAEHDARTPPADRYASREPGGAALALFDRRLWGDTAASFYRREPAAPLDDAPPPEAP